MTINILSNIIQTPSGGGNQFLKALEKEFRKRNVYQENPTQADIILFNSFNFIEEGMFFKLLKLKKLGKALVHRIDGPISLYRGKDVELDHIIYDINNQIADATVFQSQWSKEENHILGMKSKQFECIIMNAPDSDIFNSEKKIEFSNKRRIKIIATSWSNNPNKGFDVYQWLDNALDFTKYEMVFIGNSPIKFSNIVHFPAMDSLELSKKLKQSDIYITASKKDPCSNSLIEALHCKLPSIVYNDGGHPEILSNAGEVFNSKEEIVPLLEKIVTNYETYQRAIHLANIENIAEQYMSFFASIQYNKKSLMYEKIFISLLRYYLWKVKNKLC